MMFKIWPVVLGAHMLFVYCAWGEVLDPIQPFILDEAALVELTKENTPTLDKIKTQESTSELEYGLKKEYFLPSLSFSSKYAETKERPLNAFSPIMSPFLKNEIVIADKLAYGIDVEARASQEATTINIAGSQVVAKTTLFGVGATLDLWRNFWGRLDKAQLESGRIGEQISKLHGEIQRNEYVTGLRKIYWQLVANQEAIKVSERLLESSQVQAQEARLRFKNAVADKGEVARYESQVSSRKGTITYLKYQQELLLQALKNMVPQLLGKDVKVSSLDLNKTVGEVMSCISTIHQENKVPLQFTRYDDLITLLDAKLSEDLTLAKSHSDIDVKLIGSVSTKGIASDQSEAFDEAFTENRRGYQVGLNIVVPLGGNRKDNELQKVTVAKLAHGVQKTEFLSKLEAGHKFVLQSINYLYEAIKEQKTGNNLLKVRLASVKEKYRQGRISSMEVVNDQDALLSNELQLIETELKIIETLLDYLLLFQDLRCGFNQVVLP